MTYEITVGEEDVRRVIKGQLVGFVRPEKLQIATDNIMHVLKSEGQIKKKESIALVFDL